MPGSLGPLLWLWRVQGLGDEIARLLLLQCFSPPMRIECGYVEASHYEMDCV